MSTTVQMVLYPGQPGWVGTRTLRNINPICHLRCLQIPHYDSKPSLPVYLQSQNSWKKHEEPEPKDTLPHFLYTRLILDLMRSLVNHWSHLTHTSHCMTTSSHTDECESKSSHAARGVFMWDALRAATLPISRLRDQFRICWLACPEASLHQA